MKDLQSWRTSDGMGFTSCVKRVITATDANPRPDPGVTLEGINKILDRIAAISSFSSIDLKRRVSKKYTEPIGINNALSSIFRRSGNSETK
jgi:hypothetical protein